MTPQMIQSMEMLQLPMLALEQRIQQELLENPALDLLDLGEAPVDSAAAEEPGLTEENQGEAADANTDLRKVDEIDYDWDNFYDEAPPRRYRGDDEERFDLIENAPGRSATFPEYLAEQLVYVDLSEREKSIATHLVYSLDPSGYLTTPLAEAVDLEEASPPTDEELAAALKVVQRLDPPGVGARDARECLLLQIDALGTDHPLARAIVDEHLHDLAANRLPQIARSTHSDIEDIKRASHFIRTLNPHPGLEYSPGSRTHVQPDVIVDMEDGKWDVRLVGGSQPEISDTFLALFDTTKRGRQLREEILADPERSTQFKQMQELLKNGGQGNMLRDKYQSARWLVTAIAQRERTLLRVAKEIVSAQEAFLAGQSDAPAPLMMQAVADRVGIDISTVSRAVRDKYADTPIGLKPLRMFFTRAVGGSRAGGRESSNVHIMNRVREIIEAEDKKKPLKDDQIQKKLAEESIDIKRRTVAKYRSNLGFPSHSQRREY